MKNNKDFRKYAGYSLEKTLNYLAEVTGVKFEVIYFEHDVTLYADYDAYTWNVYSIAKQTAYIDKFTGGIMLYPSARAEETYMSIDNFIDSISRGCYETKCYIN